MKYIQASPQGPICPATHILYSLSHLVPTNSVQPLAAHLGLNTTEKGKW